MPVFLSTGGGAKRVVGVYRTTCAAIARFAELGFPTTKKKERRNGCPTGNVRARFATASGLCERPALLPGVTPRKSVGSGRQPRGGTRFA